MTSMVALRALSRAVLVAVSLAAAACDGTGPGNGSADVPELVFLERDDTNGQ
jgi:hypothetical protein